MVIAEAVFYSLALICTTLIVLGIIGAVVRYMEEQSDDDNDGPPAGGACLPSKYNAAGSARLPD